MTRRRRVPIYVVTGGTGRTCDHILQASLAQFADPLVKTSVHREVHSPQEAVKIVKRAAKNRGIVFHSLVEPEVREALIEQSERGGVTAVDVLGPALAVLEDQLGAAPKLHPGLSYELRKEQFDRFDAMDFTLAHDDGAREPEVDQADVVLVGASRVSKSVTCFFLAARGIRAANVPLSADREISDTLAKMDPQRVVALTMNRARLQALRETRMDRFPRGTAPAYTDLGEISRDLRYVRGLISKYGWHSIDVSYRAVEETAWEVIRILEHS